MVSSYVTLGGLVSHSGIQEPPKIDPEWFCLTKLFYSNFSKITLLKSLMIQSTLARYELSKETYRILLELALDWVRGECV